MISLPNCEYTEDFSTKLFVWCSKGSNNIKIVELDEKKEEYAKFAGVQLLNKGTNRH